MAVPAQQLTNFETVITDIAADLYQSFAANDSGVVDVISTLNILRRYIERVDRIAAIAGSVDFSGLQQLCLHFRDSLNLLYRQQRVLSNQEMEQLEQWPTLAMVYIAAPSEENANALIIFLQHTSWLVALTEEEVKKLQEDCRGIDEAPQNIHSYICDHNVDVELQDEKDYIFDSHLLETLQQEILDALGILFNELDAQVDDIQERIESTVAALELSADRIKLLGMSAATAGFFGLMDVCQLFQDCLRKLAQQCRVITPQERSKLEEWRGVTIAYLDNPNNVNSIDALVDYFNDIPWVPEISEDDTILLKDMLSPEQIELAGDTAPNAEAQEDTVEEPSEDESLDYCSEADTTYSSGPVTEQQLELIQLVRGEIEANTTNLSELLQTANSQDKSNEDRIADLRRYHDIIERFSIAAESVGLHGLHRVLGQLLSNTQHFVKNFELYSSNANNLLSQWPALASRYLNNIHDKKICKQLGDYLTNDYWPVVFHEQQVARLVDDLIAPNFPDLDEESEQRPSQAHAEDVSLILPDDVNQQLLESLLQELPSHTAEFTAAITSIVNGDATLLDIDVAKRVAHTLKGSANTVGVVGIANIAHHIEDILIAFSKHQRFPGSKLAEVLMQAADVIEMMSEALLGSGPVPDHAEAVLQAILDWANRIDVEGIPDEDESSVSFEQQKSADSSLDEPLAVTEVAAAPMLRVPSSLVDELLRLVGESIILTSQLQEQLNQAQSQTQTVREQNALFRKLAYELEQLVDVQGVASALGRDEIEEQFDSLELDQYNELHTITRRLVEATTDAREITQGVEDHLTAIDDLLVDQSRIQKQNQEAVMQTRMIPVQSIVPRLQRSVRQTCRTTGKKVQLSVDGSDTLIDSDVLNELIDPLMHVLRNAVDHGIEFPAVRASDGKPEEGTINLKFFREGDHIVVRCQDDGAGLDFDSIKKNAISKGLLETGEEISQEELARFILIPGFSTRHETSQISGRGIGMDAVYSQVLRLKGGLNIESEPAQGCTMEFRLPLTLISIHTLLVQSKQQTLAISTRGIEQVLYASAGEIAHSNGNEVFKLGEEDLELIYLESLLNLPVDREQYQQPNQPVLIVQMETGDICAILVEQVRASQDLVVKQLGQYAPSIDGIEGAAILGDGSVAPVIDIPGLLRRKSADLVNSDNVITELTNSAAQKTCALVVDDSLSARRSLAEFLQDTGYEVLTARDGLHAIDVIAQKNPDILLVDLEMPRMNGLELTAHLRNKGEFKDLPIIMITSRSTEKHRQQATRLGVDVYLTKPYAEDELLTQIEAQLVPCNSEIGMEAQVKNISNKLEKRNEIS